MLTVRIQEKNHSESIMVLKLKDGKPLKKALQFLMSYGKVNNREKRDGPLLQFMY